MNVIKVPVSETVHKFVSCFFSDAVIKYDRKEPLSLTLNAFLRKPNYGEAYRPHTITGCYIEIELSPKNVKESCTYLPADARKDLEEILLATFNQETNLLIDKLILAGWKQKKAMLFVYNFFKMSEENLTFDALVKRYQRYCNEEETTAAKLRNKN